MVFPPLNLDDFPFSVDDASTSKETHSIFKFPVYVIDDVYDDLIVGFHDYLVSVVPPGFIAMLSDPDLSGESIVKTSKILTTAEKKYMSDILNRNGVGKLVEYHDELSRMKTGFYTLMENIEEYDEKEIKVDKDINCLLLKNNRLKKVIEDEANAALSKETDLQKQLLKAIENITEKGENSLKYLPGQQKNTVATIKKRYGIISRSLIAQRIAIRSRLKYVQSCKFSTYSEPVKAVVFKFTTKLTEKYRCFSLLISSAFEADRDFKLKCSKNAVRIARKFSEAIVKFSNIYIDCVEKLIDIIEFASMIKSIRKKQFDKKVAFLDQLKTKQSEFTKLHKELQSMIKAVNTTSIPAYGNQLRK